MLINAGAAAADTRSGTESRSENAVARSSDRRSIAAGCDRLQQANNEAVAVVDNMAANKLARLTR